MSALSEDSIDWVTALHKRNHWRSSCAKVAKPLLNRTPDIHNKGFFTRTPIAGVLHKLYDLGKCSFLLVCPFASARVGL
jgi:hypothetical protein